MNTTDILLWGVLPYVVLLIFIGGTIWRYKYDQFGWTTRSSSLYEGKLLRIASPLFHFGILAVLIGHIVGLVIPKSWTDFAGVSEYMYHIMALTIGMFAGFGTLVGLALLIYRRRTTGPVFMATTNNDKMMYVLLVLALLAGIATTLISVFDNTVVNYRETVSRGSARYGSCSRTWAPWPRRRPRSRCTCCSRSRCSSPGRSPA